MEVQGQERFRAGGSGLEGRSGLDGRSVGVLVGSFFVGVHSLEWKFRVWFEVPAGLGVGCAGLCRVGIEVQGWF